MNRLYVLLIIVVCMACQSSHQTTLKGVIKNYNGAVVRISQLGNPKRDTLDVNEKGEFLYHPAASEKGEVYEVLVKEHFVTVSLFLSAGDRENLELTLLPEKKLEYVFSCDRENENAYLAALNAMMDSREWYSPEVTALPFKDFQARLNEKEKQLQLLEERIADKESRLQLARQANLAFLTRRSMWHIFTDKKADDPNFAAFVKTINLNDSLACNEFILENVIAWYSKQDSTREQNDERWKNLEWIGRLVTDRQMKDAYLTSNFRKSLKYAGSVDLQKPYEVYMSLCTDEELKREISEEYKEYVRVNGNMKEGCMAPDFEMIGVDGEKCRLSDFRGKLLFIDVWATWCAPCRKELPHMAKLKEHFKKDDRIEIISVSLDNNIKTWQKFLEKEKPTWKQFVVDKKAHEIINKEYRIEGIPHFMLLDGEGRIVAYSFVLPSDERCIGLLEKHLNR